MESILIVRNSKSGLIDQGEEIKEGIFFLKESGFLVHEIYIEDVISKEHFDKKCVKYTPKTVIALGGDGTVNLLANHLVGSEIRLAVIPYGTFNHFAKHIGIGTEIKGAFETVITGETINIDTAEVNGKVFVNFSCVGFYSQLIKRRVTYQKMAWKKWTAFAIAVFKSVINFTSFNLQIKKNDKEIAIKTPLIFVGNNIFEFGGPDILSARDDFNSGTLHISIAKDRGRLGILWLLILSLFIDIKNKAGFTTIALKEIEINSKYSSLWVSLDGEIVKMATPLKYIIRPQSLRVIVPKD
ncbi:MAG: hypothetical protein H0U27_03530 [Nitrosopumilus sp.]|nr:hypothetical protein [Nitrosopumilus sp.]MBA3551116.1 hypothetical protein [Patescibacteria group bacterium]